MTDPTVAQWQERVRDAAARKSALRIRGGGTKDFYGETPTGDGLDTRAYSGVIDYDPTELVITARCGTPLTEVESVMASRGQMLAFEPPHFGPGATLGGAVAAGLSGPRRAYAGAVRDVVLGVRMLDGQGTDLTFGGRVMKNVAGFDVSRAMTGAMGTLGILLDVSLKCLPLPRTTLTLVSQARASEAIMRMNQWGGKPYPISATCHSEGRLYVRLSGAEPAVATAARTLGGDRMAEGEAFWQALREHTLPVLGNARELWRLSVRSTAPHLDFPGDQVIEWGGALRWLALPTRGDAARLRSIASEHGGHATLFRTSDPRTGVFTPLPAVLETIHRRLKSTFDPAGILNPGRLYPDL
ncbi:MAG TPA: glycolate oxidase subunit GlcE [Casimicrobiaceae bacterium]|nr:glycolate oxidase subunit GlcE [Casimicrobiaceae bacterium]